MASKQNLSIYLGNPEEQAAFVNEYAAFLSEWRELQDTIAQVMLHRTLDAPDMTALEGLADDDPVVVAKEDRYKADLASFILARTAIDDFSEILTLASNGYGVGALKILRGMYERIVTSAYVALYPEVSRALIDSIWTHSWRMWRRVTEMMPNYSSSLEESQVEELKKNATEAQARHRESYCKTCKQLIRVHAWTKVDLETMAKMVDARLTENKVDHASLAGYYMRAYLQPTAIEHATGVSINEKFELVDGQWTYKMDSSKERRQALLFGHALILALLGNQNQHFGYGLKELLKQRVKAYREIWGLLANKDGGEDTSGTIPISE